MNNDGLQLVSRGAVKTVRNFSILLGSGFHQVEMAVTTLHSLSYPSTQYIRAVCNYFFRDNRLNSFAV
jgi:hypothetical protein